MASQIRHCHAAKTLNLMPTKNNGTVIKETKSNWMQHAGWKLLAFRVGSGYPPINS